MQNEEILQLIESQKTFFAAQKTKSIDFRLEQLKKLKKITIQNKKRISEAIAKDLRRSDIDSYMGEIFPAIQSIDYALKNLKKWAEPKKVKGLVIGKSYIVPEPYGLSLIISPWNYPYNTSLLPAVASIASGNCVILKPSEISQNTTEVIADLINNAFDKSFFHVVKGGVEETGFLLNQKFDHIFFTGSTKVGKIVYEAAAKNLTPVVLELGGKSPCIVDKDTDLSKTVRRILWGKTFNCGQTCTAPDYLFIDEVIKEDFIESFKINCEDFFGKNIKESEFYSRIINEKHFDRISNLMKDGEIIFGGEVDRDDLFISPTLLHKINPDDKIMQEEIFGPLLPVMTYSNIDEVINFVNQRPKPLALYVFSKNKDFVDKVLSQTSSGGVSVNDVLMHNVPEDLPFGGVGESGTGRYHGKAGFDNLSNLKSVFENHFAFDRDFLYPPYKFIKAMGKFFRITG